MLSAATVLSSVPVYAAEDTDTSSAGSTSESSTTEEESGESVTSSSESEDSSSEDESVIASSGSESETTDDSSTDSGSTSDSSEGEETESGDTSSDSETGDESSETSDSDDTDEENTDEETITTTLTSQWLQNSAWSDTTSVSFDGETVTIGSEDSESGLEALSFQLDSIDDSYAGSGVSYSAYVVGDEGSGWQENYDGADVGAAGDNITAVRMSLTGAISDDYSIWYRAYVSGIGWMGWTSDSSETTDSWSGVSYDDIAGTVGLDYNINALQVAILPKDNDGETLDSTDETVDYSYLTTDVVYQAHVQSIGWQDAVSSGEDAGTSGQSLRMEAVRIKAPGISYRTYIQGVGWESDWSESGEVSGTTGQKKRLEAIQIELTGGAENYLDVYYRAHVQKVGWTAWAKNGESAGSSGCSCRMEALEIVIVPKDSEAPDSSGSDVSFTCLKTSDITYSAYVQRKGWTSEVKNGASAGTTGQSLRMEALKISTNVPGLGVTYRSHIQNYGWETKWQTDGGMSGTKGQGLRLEAIELKLTGEAASSLDVYYRVHVQHFGWTDWAKNGESCGSAGFGYRIEAIQIVIRSKAQSAPGNTAIVFHDKNAATASYPQASAELDEVGWSLDSAMTAAAGLKYKSTGISVTASNVSKLASYGFTNSRGDAGVMAACFYQMAEALGYDAHMMYGYLMTTSGEKDEHAWVEIDDYDGEGETRVFDPYYQHVTDNSGFAFTYGTKGTWRYLDASRLN
jgi:uncharacterized protein YjdB